MPASQKEADCVDRVPSGSKLHEDDQPNRRLKAPRSEREFDPSKYSSRLIALKLAYLGQKYNGFEYHANNATPLPTIEETLWKALMKARLLFPTPNPAILEGEPNFEGCEFSKCGRTDKGVSAFGQVIGIRVRSNRPLSRSPALLGEKSNGLAPDDGTLDMQEMELAAPSLEQVDKGDDLTSPTSTISFDEATLSFHPIHDEIPYCQVLNRLLPPDIRILAWCPAPPLDFSARFSCKERRYTYFFTQPAFTPNPSSTVPLHRPEGSQREIKEGYLNIPLMQAAAQKFEGLHDFRNFCKIDASKQIANFERRIFHAGVTELDGPDLPAAYTAGLGDQARDNSGNLSGGGVDFANNIGPGLCAFTVHGSAFLWHQIRHMVAILFLVGQGLEPPSLVDDLLDTAKTPCRPQYDMADDAPLVLWDCVFPRQGGAVDPRTGRGLDAMEWVYVGTGEGKEPGLAKGPGKTNGRHGFGGVVDDLWKVWRGRKMDEVLAGTLLNVVVRQGSTNQEGTATETGLYQITTTRRSRNSQEVFQGGNGPKYAGRYVPVMQKPRMESVEAINERYRERKGFETREEVKATGMRSIVLEREGGDDS